MGLLKIADIKISLVKRLKEAKVLEGSGTIQNEREIAGEVLRLSKFMKLSPGFRGPR